MNEFKVGDIVVESWGYSMTLYTFYKVTRVSASSVWYQPMTKVFGNDDPSHLLVKPQGINFNAKVERKSKKTYVGQLYDPNRDYYENHMD